MVYYLDGEFLYVLCELDDLFSVFSYDDEGIKHIQTIKAYDREGRGSVDIHISNDGNYLYIQFID